MAGRKNFNFMRSELRGAPSEVQGKRLAIPFLGNPLQSRDFLTTSILWSQRETNIPRNPNHVAGGSCLRSSFGSRRFSFGWCAAVFFSISGTLTKKPVALPALIDRNGKTIRYLTSLDFPHSAPALLSEIPGQLIDSTIAAEDVPCDRLSLPDD